MVRIHRVSANVEGGGLEGVYGGKGVLGSRFLDIADPNSIDLCAGVFFPGFAWLFTFPLLYLQLR